MGFKYIIFGINIAKIGGTAQTITNDAITIEQSKMSNKNNELKQ